ncbi:MAG TPA: cytochrome-c peroxidase, partial [Saprospiraceae bacterium]|nr:cytochrome-c peroxidase [Saprospiraceae bacterium]
LAGNSPYFQYLNQDKKQALSAEAVRGMNLFFGEKAACGQCHSGWLLTNQGYANNGLYLQYSDPGKMRLTGLAQDEALFKIPSLHNVALTAPYMFDGSLPDLASVIEHYASGGQPHVNRHPAIKPFVLTAGEKADLIAFLHSLTDSDFIHQPALARP